MKIFKLFKAYMLEYKFSFFAYLFINLFISIINIVVPLISGKFIDNLTSMKSKSFLFYYCIIFSIISVINLVLNFLSSYLYVKIQTRAGYKLNLDILEHLKKVSLLYFSDCDIAYLTQRINSDANEIIIFCIGIIVNIIVNIFTLIFTTIILININYKIAILLLILLLIYILIYRFFKEPLYKYTLVYREAQSKFFSNLNEQLNNIKFIKAHAVNDIFLNRLENSFKSLFYKALSHQKVAYLFSSCDTIILTLTQILVYIIGGLEIINGHLTIGIFTVILSYFSRMMTSIRYFFNLSKDYQSTLVSYNRILQILKVQQQITGTIKLDTIDSISIKNLHFKYNNNMVFEKYNINFEKNKIYSVFGSNGSGKTTLINLILGLYINDYGGDIKYNNIDIKDLDMIYLRKYKIGVTEQEPILIPDTLLSNIILNKEVSPSLLQEYFELLNLSDYINSLDKGLQTIINDKSSNISGGEKQKISIIRQFIKNPDIMIFDEPTSALDYVSKTKFCDYIQSIKLNKIIILISHDETLKTISDEVIILGDNLQ